MSARPLPTVAALALALFLSACGALRFESQELSTLYDEGSDVLTLELVYHAVSAVDKLAYTYSGDELESAADGLDLERSTAALVEMSTGRRRFMLFDPLLDFSLDRASQDDAHELPDFERRMTLWRDGITMEEARLFLDDAGQLTLYQRLKLRNLSEGLALWNAMLRRDLIESFGERDQAADDLYVDVATLELALADAAAGRDWVQWTGAGLALSLPASPQWIARALSDGVAGLAEAPAEKQDELRRFLGALSKLLAPLSRFTIQNDHVELLFAPAADGWMRLDLPAGTGEPGYDPTLAAYLADEGVSLPVVWTRGD